MTPGHRKEIGQAIIRTMVRGSNSSGLLALLTRLQRCKSVGKINDLDISPKSSILVSISRKFSLPVNLQPNPNLPETAMKERHLKFLDVKPPRESYALSEAFLSRR
jgi:hypothetical protein